jgi:hypothetical protein
MKEEIANHHTAEQILSNWINSRKMYEHDELYWITLETLLISYSLKEKENK